MSDELSDVLHSIHSEALRLEALLADEGLILKEAREPESLEALAQKKMDLVQNIELLELRRRQLVSSGNVQDEALWQEALAVLSRCQDMNNQAGANISTQARYGKRALDILGATNNEVPLYSPGGETNSTLGGQRLGKA